IFIIPEILALYLQFDSQPQKIVFEQKNVSGIRFFFWDSQFGRFFNFGPIQKTVGTPLFFVQTFFWAFFPWCIIFIVSVYQACKNFKKETFSNKNNFLYLMTSFAITFVLFSATNFRLDHYTNIIFPFAAIICAQFLFNLIQEKQFYPRM